MSNELKIAMYIVWVTIIVIFIIIEICTLMYLGWAGTIAGTISLIIHAIVPSILVEVLVFIFLWILLWLIFFAIMYKISKRNISNLQDGYNAYIGKEYKAIRSNVISFGSVSINDKVFRFTSKETIRKDEYVKVLEISGVTFKVKKVSRKKS